MKWTPIFVGFAIGAIAGYLMGGMQNKGGSNPLGITGGFAKPFQWGIDNGKGRRGG